MTTRQPAAERMPEQAEDSQSNEQNNAQGGISLLEWVIAVIGLALVIGVIFFLSVEALRDNGQPPNLHFDVVKVEPVNGGYVVEVSLRNEGDQTAADVTVIGQLSDGETVVEEREMTFDYVPPNSSRRGGLFFTHDPSALTLTFHPDGYQEP